MKAETPHEKTELCDDCTGLRVLVDLAEQAERIADSLEAIAKRLDDMDPSPTAVSINVSRPETVAREIVRPGDGGTGGGLPA